MILEGRDGKDLTHMEFRNVNYDSPLISIIMAFVLMIIGCCIIYLVFIYFDTLFRPIYKYECFEHHNEPCDDVKCGNEKLEIVKQIVKEVEFGKVDDVCVNDYYWGEKVGGITSFRPNIDLKRLWDEKEEFKTLVEKAGLNMEEVLKMTISGKDPWRPSIYKFVCSKGVPCKLRKWLRSSEGIAWQNSPDGLIWVRTTIGNINQTSIGCSLTVNGKISGRRFVREFIKNPLGDFKEAFVEVHLLQFLVCFFVSSIVAVFDYGGIPESAQDWKWILLFSAVYTLCMIVSAIFIYFICTIMKGFVRLINELRFMRKNTIHYKTISKKVRETSWD